jgi:hypothetical protein
VFLFRSSHDREPRQSKSFNAKDAKDAKEEQTKIVSLFKTASFCHCCHCEERSDPSTALRTGEAIARRSQGAVRHEIAASLRSSR